MRHSGTAVIETERLLLRPFCLEDAEEMFAGWASSKKVTEFLTWPAHADISVTRNILAGWCSRYQDPSFYQWCIVRKKDNAQLGTVSVVSLDEDSGSLEIGYCIGEAHWHQGYVSEALNRLLQFFFEQERADRIEARHDVRNPRSGMVMKRCGMRYVRTDLQAARNSQGMADCAYYEISRQEYEEAHGKLQGSL